jgi:hypothetical protein
MERVMAPSKTESRRRCRRKPVTGQVISLALAAFAAMAVLSLARAHGPAEWINTGGYKNAAGELCCGERDCFELAEGDVAVVAVGYFVRSIGETVPFSEAQPSPDGRYWRCQWGGSRKCFFAPPPST